MLDISPISSPYFPSLVLAIFATSSFQFPIMFLKLQISLNQARTIPLTEGILQNLAMVPVLANSAPP